jgi:dipeptide/tripeptide permease
LLDEVRRVFSDIWAGLREVARRPGAGLGLTGFFVTRTVLVSFAGLYLVLEARDILGGDSGQAGIAIAGGVGAIGAALGFVGAQVLRNRTLPQRMMVVSMTSAGVGLALVAGLPGLLGVSLVAFVAALGFFLSKVAADTVVQSALPDRFRGRGFSLFDIAYNLGWVVAAFALYVLTDQVSRQVQVVGVGVVLAAIGLALAAWSRAIGRIEQVERPEAVAAAEGVQP